MSEHAPTLSWYGVTQMPTEELRQLLRSHQLASVGKRFELIERVQLCILKQSGNYADGAQNVNDASVQAQKSVNTDTGASSSKPVSAFFQRAPHVPDEFSDFPQSGSERMKAPVSCKPKSYTSTLKVEPKRKAQVFLTTECSDAGMLPLDEADKGSPRKHLKSSSARNQELLERVRAKGLQDTSPSELLQEKRAVDLLKTEDSDMLNLLIDYEADYDLEDSFVNDKTLPEPSERTDSEEESLADLLESAGGTSRPRRRAVLEDPDTSVESQGVGLAVDDDITRPVTAGGLFTLEPDIFTLGSDSD